MSTQLKNRSSYELLKIMQDGKWYDSKYLKIAAGKYIAPEIASRADKHRPKLSVELGRGHIIGKALATWHAKKRIEGRIDDNGTEWHLIDTEWANKLLEHYDKKINTPSVKPISPAENPPAEKPSFEDAYISKAQKRLESPRILSTMGE